MIFKKQRRRHPRYVLPAESEWYQMVDQDGPKRLHDVSHGGFSALAGEPGKEGITRMIHINLFGIDCVVSTTIANHRPDVTGYRFVEAGHPLVYDFLQALEEGHQMVSGPKRLDKKGELTLVEYRHPISSSGLGLCYDAARGKLMEASLQFMVGRDPISMYIGQEEIRLYSGSGPRTLRIREVPRLRLLGIAAMARLVGAAKVLEGPYIHMCINTLSRYISWLDKLREQGRESA